ncbi:RHS repeat-associated core domain-containing protein [Aequorivita sp. KMM 9714]|uniref:RHS repeat-associated core domain-containing protein n=1 Tax=Aequorivita sp. KMM 9714 TaxID=2707173 RepID=UPI0013EA0A62|nr:RHS repeat-associated core domain-containing protein [Aequorivita sp. KMM 9714]NGX85383.1 RHS repeat-associated core domain-containing protein [Aequorivita sp. KMM 9714]
MKKTLIFLILISNSIFSQQLVWKESSAFLYDMQNGTLTSQESKSLDSYMLSESELGYNNTGYIEVSDFKLNGSAITSQSAISIFSLYLTFENTFSLAEVHQNSYSITYVGDEGKIYINGPQGNIAVLNNIILVANDIMRIEKTDANKVLLKYNSQEYLITDNYVENAYIALRTNTPNFSFSIGESGFRPPTEPTDIVVEDFDRNWIFARTFDNAGKLTSAGVTYYDCLAKPEQTQSRDIRTGKTWASQTMYDYQGRLALQSFSAPVSPNSTPRFNYAEGFIKKPNGDPFAIVDFETNPERPEIVGTQEGTVGRYYSTANNAEPFQDITDRPYARTVYDDLNPGNGRMVVGGKIMDLNNDGDTNDPEDGFPQGFTYTMPAAQELYYAFGKTYFSNFTYPCDGAVCVDLKSYKTVSIDPHGNETVAFTDAEGKLLGTARSGGNVSYDVVYVIGAQGYVDVHIPQGITTTSFIGNISEYTVYDLRTGLLVDPPTSISGGNIYRVVNQNSSSYPMTFISPSGEITYNSGLKGITTQVNYYDYSLNYYDKAGNLKRTVQPLGFDEAAYDLGTEIPSHSMASLYEYNAAGELQNTTSPDQGDAQFVYREDGQILFSLNTEQAIAEEFSYTAYDSKARPIESGVCTGTNPYFPLTFNIVPNFVVQDSITAGSGSFTKTGTSDDWVSSGIVSVEDTGTGNFRVSFNFIQGKEGVVGLSETNINGSYTSVEHAMYFLNGQISILNSGTTVASNVAYFSIGDVFSIERIGNALIYKKNNGIIFQETPWLLNSSYPELYVDGALYSQGASAHNMTITGLSGDPIPSTPPEDFVLGNDRREQIFTVYDIPDTEGLWEILYPFGDPTSDPLKRRQRFVAGNVSKTYTKEPETTTTWYSYDIYGRVEWMVQFINGIGAKTIDYEYDDATGAVTMVRYQKDKASERFTHKYIYNNVGELVTVQTSRDNVNFIEHAQYEYYETGAVKRVNLAEGLQGIDYIYTLEGQLKAINHPGLSGTDDPGGDPNDAFGYVIDYHQRDYSRIGVGNINWSQSGTDRFDGNIKGVRWGTKGLTPTGTQSAYQYNYNQNNWLTHASFGSASDDMNNHSIFTPNTNADYMVEKIFYDPNGNILSLNRNKNSGTGSNSMDTLIYHYAPDSNQLDYVEDTSGNSIDDGDIKDQNPNNYVYNSIGQLIENKQDDIGYDYYATGLVKSVFSTVSNDPKKVEFFYNDRGHRVSKLTTMPNNTQQQTFYVRDASGSAMAIYNTSIGIGTEPSNNIEYPIYGLSRLGVADQGNIFKYQLSDHLGNVRAVIQRDGSGTVVFFNDFNNNATVPAGWVAGPNTALSIDTTNDRLKASVSNINTNSLARNFSVVAGHSYKIDFKTDLDQTPCTLQYRINAIGGTGSGVYTAAINGTYTFNYTATSNGTVTLLFKLLNSYAGTSLQNVYYLDDVKVTDITTTNTPLMLAYKDYYPFGMPMPDRNQEGAYRYAYQGQEKDAETGMEAFELRLWDARIGRWLTTDPYGQYHSPYLGMGNNPISSIDPNGGWETKWGRFWGWVGNGFKGTFVNSENPGTPWHKYGIMESSTSSNGVYRSYSYGSGWKNKALDAGYTFQGGYVHFTGLISPMNTLSQFEYWRNEPTKSLEEGLFHVAVEATYGSAEGIYSMFSGGRTFTGEVLQGKNAFDKSFDGFITTTTLGFSLAAKTLKPIKSSVSGWNSYQKATEGLYSSTELHSNTIKSINYKSGIQIHNTMVKNVDASVETFETFDSFIQNSNSFINALNEKQ